MKSIIFQKTVLLKSVMKTKKINGQTNLTKSNIINYFESALDKLCFENNKKYNR
jgi:hypothetical protein